MLQVLKEIADGNSLSNKHNVYFPLKCIYFGPTLQALGSHMDISSNLGGPVSHPAPCLWPGKAAEDSPKP